MTYDPYLTEAGRMLAEEGHNVVRLRPPPPDEPPDPGADTSSAAPAPSSPAATERRAAGEAAPLELVYGGPDPQPPPDLDLDGWLALPEPEYQFIVPDLLERGDRVVVTADEGAGKSTLLRQVGLQVASGFHPFTHAPMDPIRVLYVDLENSRGQFLRKVRPLRLKCDVGLAPGMFTPVLQPEGIDLRRLEFQQWLEERVVANRPDLLLVGPLYKMADGDPTSEETGKAVSTCLDRLRTRYRFALMIEAHNPHPSNGGARPTRPYGWSGWLRWPEFGLHLTEEGVLTHWRGQRDERAWPTRLKRGGDWPWDIYPPGVTPPPPAPPAGDGIKPSHRKVLDAIREAAEPLSVAQIALQVDAAEKTVHNATRELRIAGLIRSDPHPVTSIQLWTAAP